MAAVAAPASVRTRGVGPRPAPLEARRRPPPRRGRMVARTRLVVAARRDGEDSGKEQGREDGPQLGWHHRGYFRNRGLPGQGRLPAKESCCQPPRGVGCTYHPIRVRPGCRIRGLRFAPVTDRRQRLLNPIAGVAFAIGGSLFALGAAIAQVGSQNPRTAACVYFAGGLCFNTGGYATVLAALNPPGTTRWRWWAWEPERVEWLSAAVLFAGTIVFGVNLLDSFLQGLTAKQVNRLIWAPDMVGCALFIVSGHLALAQICRRRICWKPRNLDWWIAALNQVGSYLFLVSALAAFVNPETSSVVNEAVANWGTFGGALCFAIGGVIQAFGGLHHRDTRASAIAGRAA